MPLVAGVAALLLGARAAGARARAPIRRTFTGATMRVDYFHTGGPKAGETIALDRVVYDGPWPAAARSSSIRPNLGKYYFEVRDSATRTLLYSRGFASVYGEWETTDEAKTAHRTFHESLRFPWPREPVAVVCQKRQADNSFRRSGSTDIDPASRFVNPRRSSSTPGTSGRCSRTARRRRRSTCSSSARATPQREMPKFHADVERLLGRCSRRSRSRAGARTSTCARSICRRRESGVNRPNAGVVPPHADLGRVQHLRFRALRADARQSRAARRGVGGALRVHRDPRQREEVRRRRDLQRSGHGVRRQRLLRSTCSCTSSAITSRRWPTSTTRRMSPTRPAAARSSGAVGAERDRAARSGHS